MNAAQRRRVRSAISQAYSSRKRAMRWTKTDKDSEISSIDTWTVGNDITYKTALSSSYKTLANPRDQELLLIAVLVAKRLIAHPGDLTTIRNMLTRLKGIGGL